MSGKAEWLQFIPSVVKNQLTRSSVYSQSSEYTPAYGVLVNEFLAKD